MGLQGLVLPFQRFAETTRSLADLAAAMASLTTQLGFRHFAVTDHVDRAIHDGAIRLHNYPEAWVRTYDSKGWGVVDPVHRRSHLTATGFWWRQMEDLAPMSRSERQMMDLAAAGGISNGYTVPVHLPGELASCTFANPIGLPSFPHIELLAQLAGHAAFEAARRLLPRRHHRHPGLRPVLTRQQRIILQLLSEGKTDFEISRILGFKEETAGSHVRDIFARYGVNKRTLLISLAWQDGYVTYPK